MPHGPFMSLDGLDGTGKSTQCRLLAQRLRDQGLGVVECADPGGTAVGDVIRELLLGQRHQLAMPTEALLFMASRAQLTADVIRPALEAGRAVVADRFLLANVVYQGHAGGLDPEQLWQVGRLATRGLEPDLTIVLDLPLEVALARRTGKGDRFENRALDYHARVQAGFRNEARRQPERIHLVDASGPVAQVQAEIWTLVAASLKNLAG